MPTIIQTFQGRVTGLWGTATMRGADGRMHALKLGDMVHKGDVILTSQDGIVQLSPGETATAQASPAAPSASPDIDRVISGLNDLDSAGATAAGVTGGDGAGDLTPGLRVGRIAELVGPAGLSLPSDEGNPRFEPRGLGGPIAEEQPAPRPAIDADSNTIQATEEGPAVGLGLAAPTGVTSVAVITVTLLPLIGTLQKADGTPVTLGSVLTTAELTGLKYLPPADYDGTAPVGSFGYTVSDQGSTVSGGVGIELAPINDAPVANPDAATTPEDTPISGNVLSNDTDVDGNTLAVTQYTIAGVPHPAGSSTTILGIGTIVLNGNGSYTFTPAADYHGPVPPIGYTLSDGTVTTTSTLTLTVTPVNDPPDAIDDIASTPINVPVTVAVLTNDTDKDGDPLTVTGATMADPTKGSVVVNPNGTVTFTPANNYVGPVTITYTVSDGHGGTDTATVTVNVGTNTPPDGADSTRTIAEDSSYTVQTADFGFTDADAGQTLANVRIDALPAAGALLLAGAAVHAGDVISAADVAAGKLVFVPVADANGTPYASFSFSVQDSAGAFDTAPNTVTVNVTPVNDVPVAVTDGFNAIEDQAFIGTVAGNDTLSGDGGNVFALVAGSGPAHGGIVFNADGTFTYTPGANYNGPDTFSYSLTDADGDVSTAVVTINVASVNDVPVAVADTVAAVEDTPFVGTVAGNDTLSGDGGNTFALVAGSGPAHGGIVFNADGTFTYTPSANYNGADTFSYSLTDADGDTSIAVVTINVASVNDVPVALADTVAAVEDTPFVGTVAGNDTLSGDGGNVFALVAGSGPAHGGIVFNADGTFTYTPGANYNGPDTFSYSLTDADGDVSTAVVTINVASVNDVPVAVADTVAAVEDTPFVGTVAGNDTLSGDGGNVFALVAGSGPAHGGIVFNADGTFTYTPGANYNGPDTFSYSLTDADGDVSTAVVTINVASVNDVPVALADTVAAVEDTPFVGTVAGNDTLSGDGGNTFALVAGSGPAHGGIVFNADGTFTYTPGANYNGPDTFSYSLTDADGDVSTAVVTINVASVNDVPVAVADTVAAVEDTPFVGTVAGNDTLSGDGGNVFALVAGSGPAHGGIVFNADGTFTYTPGANYNGPDSFSYSLTDADGDVSTAVVTINVASVNDVPVAVADTVAAVEDTPFVGTVAGNDTLSGDGGNVFALVAGSGPAHGGIVFNADGTFTYTPGANYNGPDTFSYSLTDADGDVSTAVVTISVAPVNDAPAPLPDVNTTPEDTPLIVDAAHGVLANDSDVDSATLTVTQFSVAGLPGSFVPGGTATIAGVGALTINDDGSYSFTPVANYNGPGPVATYTVSDGTLTSTSTLTLTVTPVNDAPVLSLDNDQSHNTVSVQAIDGLFNTGESDARVALALGQTDTHYSVLSQPAGGTASNTAVQLNYAWVQGDADAAWIGSTASEPQGLYTYQTSFTLQAGADPRSVVIGFDLATDNNLVDILINGVSTGIASNVQFFALTHIDLNGANMAFQAGANTITFVVDNRSDVAFQPGEGPTGLLIDNMAGSVAVIASSTTTHVGDYATLFVEGAGPVSIADTDTRVTDIDSPNLQGATITLTNAQLGDVMSAGVLPAGIVATVDATGTVVTLSGMASLASYEAAIRAVQFGNTSNDPPDAIDRVITVVVRDDGGLSSNVVTTTVHVIPVDTPPVLDLDGDDSTAGGTGYVGTYVENGSGVRIVDLDDIITDLDSTTLHNATIRLTNVQVGDLLSVGALPAGITTSVYDPTHGVLTLTGIASLADYQAALRAITFSNTTDHPDGTTRAISITVNDGGGSSNVATALINVVPVNDAPAGTDKTVTTLEDTAYTLGRSDFGFTDPLDAPASNNFASVTVNPTSAGTLTLNGSAITAATLVTVAELDAGLLKFTPAQDANGSAYATLSFQVKDDGGTANGGVDTDPSPNTITFDVTPVNDPPVALPDVNTVSTASTGVVQPISTIYYNDSAAGTLVAIDVATGTHTVLQTGVPAYLDIAQAPDGRWYAIGPSGGLYTFDPATGEQSLINASVGAYNALGFSPSGTLYSTSGTRLNSIDLVTGVVTASVPGPGASQARGDIVFVGNFAYLSTTNNTIVKIDMTGASPITTLVSGVTALSMAVLDDNHIVAFNAPVGSGPATPALIIDLTTGGATSSPLLYSPGLTAYGGAENRHVDRTVSGGVLGNDTDPDGGPLVVTHFGQASQVAAGSAVTGAFGKLVINADGSYTYVLDTSSAAYKALALNATTTDVFTYSISDGNGGTASSTLTITVVGGNDAPSARNDLVSMIEGDPAKSGNVLTNDSDVDGDALTVQSYVVNGTTYAVGTTNTISGVGTLLLNANGSYVFTPSVNYAATTTVIYRVSDGKGGVDIGNLIISETPVNDAPAGADKTLTTLEDTAYTLARADFGFTDPTDTPANAFASVTVNPTSAGTLTLNGSAITAATLVTVAELDAGLLKFTPAQDANGNAYATLSFRVKDDGGTANGGVDTDPSPNTITFNVTPVNDAPAGTNKTVTATEDASYTLARADFGFTDTKDTPANTFASVTVNPTSAGTLTLNNVTVTAATIVTVAQLDAGLLKFTPVPNANGSAYATLSFQVKDDGGTANGGIDTDQSPNTLTFDVTPVNDAPIATGSAALAPVPEDTLNPAGATVASLFLGSFSDPTDAANPTMNQFAGVAVRGQFVSAAQGRWQYSTDGGTTWKPFGGISDTNAVALLPTDQVRFLPAADYNGTPANLSVRLIDNSTTVVSGAAVNVFTHGGITPYSDTIVTMSTAVTPVNDAPAGADKTLTTAEDTAYTLARADFGFTDPKDLPANNFASIVVNPSSAGTLSLNGAAITAATLVTVAQLDAGLLKFTPAQDANGNAYATLQFQVRDDGGTANGGVDTDQSPNTLTFNVSTVNDAPVNTIGPISTLEDTSVKLSGLSITDLDAGGGSMTVTLGVASGTITATASGGVGIAGSGSATITLTGTLASINAYLAAAASQPVYKPVLDASGPVQLTMTTNDNGNTGAGGALSDVDVTTINVIPVADVPTLAPTTSSWKAFTEDWQDKDPSAGSMTWTSPTAIEASYTQNDYNPVQNPHTALAPSDNVVMEIEGAIGTGQNVTISSSVVFATGGQVVNIGFDTIRRDQGLGGDPSDAQVQSFTVFWNGVAVGHYDPSATAWTTAQLQVTSIAGANLLTFQSDDQLAGHTLGDIIDNVSVATVGDALVGGTAKLASLAGLAAFGDSIDNSEIHTLTLNSIPVGATLTDGTHTFTATAGSTTVTLFNEDDPAGATGGSNWDLANLSLVGQAGFAGTVTMQFTATATEGANGSTASVSEDVLAVYVAHVNGAPIANADTASVTEDVPFATTAATGVLANDTDVDAGDTKTVSTISFGSTLGTIDTPITGLYGTLTMHADGSYTYLANQPAAEVLAVGQTATEQFTYAMHDTAGLASSSTLTFTIAGANDAPVAFDDIVITNVAAGQPIAIASGALPYNDTDIDNGTVLAVSNSFNAINGTVAGTSPVIFKDTSSFGVSAQVQDEAPLFPGDSETNALNNSIATAYEVDRGRFGQVSAADAPYVGDSTLPSFKWTGRIEDVNGTPNATDQDFIKVYLHAGEKIILDIDGADSGSTDIGANPNAVDTLLQFYDAAGNVLAENDDALPTEGGLGSVKSGYHNSSLDSYIEYTVAADGYYYVNVTAFNNNPNGIVQDDGNYTLWMSIKPTATPYPTSFDYTTSDGIASDDGHVLVTSVQGSVLNGTAANEILIASDANDTLNGGGGNDWMQGGKGSDSLTGGSGADVFAWVLADRGSAGAPPTDTITDFSVAAPTSGGDILDLRDLLQGEAKAGTSPGNLQNYLDFDTTSAPGSTIVHISSSGGFSGGTYSAGAEDQRIVLQGVDVRSPAAFGLSSAATDNDVIQQLLQRGKLVTDGP